METNRETRDTGTIVENNEEEMIGEGAPVTPETDPETDADADGEETSLSLDEDVANAIVVKRS